MKKFKFSGLLIKVLVCVLAVMMLVPSIGVSAVSEKTDEGFTELVNSDNRIKVAHIDPENIAASLEAALFE